MDKKNFSYKILHSGNTFQVRTRIYKRQNGSILEPDEVFPDQETNKYCRSCCTMHSHRAAVCRFKTSTENGETKSGGVTPHHNSSLRNGAGALSNAARAAKKTHAPPSSSTKVLTSPKKTSPSSTSSPPSPGGAEGTQAHHLRGQGSFDKRNR